MIKKNSLTEIASFRNSGSVLQPFDDERDLIDLREIKSSSSELFSNFSVSTLNSYLKSFYPAAGIEVSSKNTCSKDSSSQSPLVVCIFAEHPGLNPDKAVIAELRAALSMSLELIQENANLFSRKELEGYLSEEKVSYIEDLAEKFVMRHGGKAVSKPFEYQVKGEKPFSSSIYGKIKGFAIRNVEQSEDEVFYAQVDGLKVSDMVVYFKLIDDGYKIKSAVSATYKVEKPSHLMIAAQALLEKPSIVKVVGYRKTDSKGVKNSFVKDIAHEAIEFELNPTN